MKQITKRIIILHSRSQFYEYKKKYKQKNDLIISLGPDILYLAKKYDLDYISTRDLIIEKEHRVQRLISEKKISHAIYKFNKISDNFDSNYELNFGGYFAFQIWIILGQFHFNMFLVEKIYSKFSRSKFLIFADQNSQPIMKIRPNPDRLFSEIFNKFKKINTKQFKIVEVCEKKLFLNYIEYFKSYLPENYINIIKNLLFYRKNLLTGSKRKLLLVGGEYGWKKISKYKKFNSRFVLNKFTPNFRIHNQHRASIEKSVREILNDALHFGNFQTLNLDIFTSYLTDNILKFLKTSEIIEKYLDKYEAIVSGIMSFPEDLFVAHLAKLMGKPVIIWQHGDRGQSKNDLSIKYSELTYATDYLCYSSSIAKFFKIYQNHNKLDIATKYHPVGCIPIYNKKDIIIEKKEQIILYATGKWFKTAAPFNYDDIIDPDRRLFESQYEILTYLNKKYYNQKIVFKANNTEHFNKISLNLSNIEIDYTSSFSDLLPNAKLVILDTPSTTLVESCYTNKPIFVLDGRSKYTSKYKNLIKTRVAMFSNVKTLLKSIDRYMLKESYEPKKNTKELDQYFNFRSSEQKVYDSVIKSLNKILN